MKPTPANHPLAGRFVVDADGAWLHNDVEITHERTWKFFSSALRLNDEGHYVLAAGKESVYVEVVDAPLVVTAIRRTDEGVRMRFHDDTHHVLAPSTLRFRGNVPYCEGRDGLPARFSHAAYVQLSEFCEETPQGFVLDTGVERVTLPPQE